MFVDSHAHIDGPEFDADRPDVIQRARDAGVSAILNVGTGDPHSGVLERAVELAEKHEALTPRSVSILTMPDSSMTKPSRESPVSSNRVLVLSPGER